jgi:hypothetical protein
MNLEELEFGVKIERDRNQNPMSYNFGVRAEGEKQCKREREREIITYCEWWFTGIVRLG